MSLVRNSAIVLSITAVMAVAMGTSRATPWPAPSSSGVAPLVSGTTIRSPQNPPGELPGAMRTRDTALQRTLAQTPSLYDLLV
jgi:hypothetical protein